MPQQRVHNSIPRSSSWTPFGKYTHFCTKPTQGHPKKGRALTACPRCHTAALCLGLGIGGLRPHQDAPLGSLAAAGCSGARHGLAGPGTAQQGQAQFGKARHSLAGPGTARQGQARSCSAWSPLGTGRTQLHPRQTCPAGGPSATPEPSPKKCFPPRSSSQSQISR